MADPSQPTRTNLGGGSVGSSFPSVEEGRFPAGTTLAGRFRILGLLGKGGMGEVYRALDLTLNQPVALKFIAASVHRDEAALARFRNEVRIARQVSHPNVCRVYDIGVIEGQHFLSMEYVDGEDLASLLRRIGRLPSDKALEFTRRICAGLAAAHERGVLHRDLKPANIMIDGRGQVRITDFGLAALAGDVHGGDVRSGTPAYMSPEQKAGKDVTTRSDIYALGLVLHEMFTGARPGQSQATPTTLVKDLDPTIERVIMRCLDADPRNRPSSALNVAMALPGGDPIAAALAAGETPSPEMVAASGDREGLSPRTAVLLCTALVVSLAAFAAIQEHFSMPRLFGLRSPETLADGARDTLERLGFTTRAASSASGFQFRPEEVDAASRRTGGDLQEDLARRRPSPAYFWYREDPTPLRPPALFAWGNPGSPFPYPRSALPIKPNAPPRESGSIYVELAPNGRLECLDARIMEPDAATAVPSAAVDWAAIFEQAGLPMTTFVTDEPRPLPHGPADTRLAWTARDGQPRLRVEAAAYRGRPVFFRVMSALTPVDIAPVPPAGRAQDWPTHLLMAATMIAAVAFMRRNLKLGRGDRAGATRLGLLAGIATFLSAVLGASWPSDGLFFTTAYGALSAAMFMAGLCWVFYMAVEPYVRRQWPSTLTGWTRFLRGEWRDPLAGRELLIGATIGVALAAIVCLPFMLGVDPPPLGVSSWTGLELNASSGGLRALSLGLNQICSTAWFGLAVVVMMLVACRTTRRHWLALGVLIAAVSAIFPSATLTLPQWLLVYGSVVVAMAATTVLYLRVGFLAMATMNYTFSVLTVMPVSFTRGSYFAGLAWLAVVVALAPALFGLYTSLAGRSIFLNAVEDR